MALLYDFFHCASIAIADKICAFCLSTMPKTARQRILLPRRIGFRGYASLIQRAEMYDATGDSHEATLSLFHATKTQRSQIG